MLVEAAVRCAALLVVALLLAGCATTQEREIQRISERYGHDCVRFDGHGKDEVVGLWCPDRETRQDRAWYIYPDGRVERLQ